MLFAMAAASAIPRGATAAGIHRRAQAAAAAALLATPTKAPPAGFSLEHGFVWSRRKAVVCPVVTRGPFALSHCSFSCRSSFLVEERQGSRDANEVAVFWDLNNCAVPDELDPYRIGPNIVLALRTNGFSGPISIHAYGNTRSLNDQDLLQALVATGVDLHHVPGGMKDSNMHLLVGLLLWVKGNSPPAHMLLISGDKDFSSVMHKLHMRGYNVLWAHPEGEISPDLLSAASKVWAWDSIMKGVGLAARSCITGTSLKSDKRFCSQNVSHSSQGYSKPQVQNSQDIQPELDMKKDSSNYDLKRKPQSIPKKVVEQVIDIIRLRPNGFTVAAFRRQLGRSNLILDKDFYGRKDLLSFLLSISKLKASLVWTSDRTRTYMFTEDCAESTSITDNSEATSPAGREDGKDVRSTMHVTLRVKQKSSTEEKRQVTNMVEAISDPQQQDNRSTNVEQGDKMAAEFPPDESVAKLPGLSSVYKGAFSTTLRKAFFKSNFLRRFWKILGFTITKTNIAFQETALVSKDTENNCNKKSEDTEASVCFTTSQTLQEDGKKQPTSQRKPIMELVEGNQHEVLKNALHKDIEACSSCATCESLQENGENKPVKQCDVLENLQEKREQQPVLERKSTWRLLEGKQCEVHKDTLLTLLLSRVGEDPTAKEVWRNTGFTDELWKEVISYFISEGGRFRITRTTTMDELIKILTESNLKKVAQLQEDELFQLAKFLYGEILILAQNQDVGDSESKVQSKPMEGGANGKTMLEGQNVSDASMRSEVGHSRDSEVTDAAVEAAQNVKIKDDSMLFRASKGRKSSSAEQGLCEAAVLKDLTEMVVDLLQSCKDGLPLGYVKPAFKKRYGYELNNKVLGHTSLASLLRTLEGVMISKETDEHVVVSSHSVHECDKGEEKKQKRSVGNICQVTSSDGLGVIRSKR